MLFTIRKRNIISIRFDHMYSDSGVPQSLNIEREINYTQKDVS
jgi:hypothetical protein